MATNLDADPNNADWIKHTARVRRTRRLAAVAARPKCDGCGSRYRTRTVDDDGTILCESCVRDADEAFEARRDDNLERRREEREGR